jgi:twitching motility two-component system response regulator PilG
MAWNLKPRDAVRFHHVVDAVHNHDIDLARQLLAQLEAEYPLDEDVWMWKAGVARKPSEAITALEQALTLNRANERALRMLTMVRINGGGEALPSLRGTGVPLACRVCGQRHVGAFQTCRACGCLWDHDDLNAMLNNQRTITHFLRQVVEDLEKRPTPEAAYAAAIGRLNLGDMDAALERFQHARELRPSDQRFIQWIARLEGCRVVLAVDDCRTVLNAICAVLGKHGVTVRTAVNGPEALRILKRLRPEAILLDTRMPSLDGFETCREIQKQPDLRPVPVILMSASVADHIKGKLAGAAAVMNKPFDAATLVRFVGAHRVPTDPGPSGPGWIREQALA